MQDWNRVETRRASRADQEAVAELAFPGAMADQETQEARADGTP